MRTVGDSPLVEIDGIFAKLECTNPTGSIKDRIALYIIEESEKRGRLKRGTRIVEATSGNTGIAFAYFAKQKGYAITVVMPENMSEERKQILRDLGAEVILCSKEGGFAEAVEIRDRLAREENYFNPDQFSNPLNVECHYRMTGQEILDQVRSCAAGPIGAFVAGVGTGGTLVGVGRKLKTAFSDVRIVAVEPAESAVLNRKAPGIHGIAGIGDGFIPAIVSNGKGGIDPLIDEVICVGSEEAKKAAVGLARSHSYCVGISSGANYLAAKELSLRYETVVTVFPDGYGKYQSQGLAHCETGRCPFEKDALV
jgi:cysteine synthase